MGDYTRLEVWRLSDAVAKGVYTLVRDMPRSERGALGDQLRRAALSVPANIAEGAGRNTDGDLSRHLNIALGSANEVHYLLTFARDLVLCDGEPAGKLIDETAHLRRMLAVFSSRLEASRKGNRRAAEGSRAVSESVPIADSLSR